MDSKTVAVLELKLTPDVTVYTKKYVWKIGRPLEDNAAVLLVKSEPLTHTPGVLMWADNIHSIHDSILDAVKALTVELEKEPA